MTNLRTQYEYINELKRHISRLPIAEQTDILRDQEEFFRDALASGRTELDVIGSLGDPKTLAKTLVAESRLAQTETLISGSGTGLPNGVRPSLGSQFNATTRAVLAFVTLAPFNLIFVLGPFLGLLGCLLAGWVVGASFLIAGGASIFMIFKELTTIGASVWAISSATLFAIAVIMFSLAALTFMAWLSGWVAVLTVRYLRWNLDIIQAREPKAA